MSGDTETGVTLTITGDGSIHEIPYADVEEGWRKDEACFRAITTIVAKQIEAVGYRAFTGMTSLKTFETDETMVRFGPYSFASSGLSEFVAPNLVSIEYGAFLGCSSLTGTLSIPNTMRSIGNFAFQASGIEKVDVRNVNSIFSFSDQVFQDCPNLTEFLVSDSEDGYWTFHSTGLFEGCTKLSELTGLTRCSLVGPRTFMGCTSLSSFPFNSYCSEWGESAFENTGFWSIDILNCNPYLTIGRRIFSNCRRLGGVHCHLSHAWSESAFEYCEQLSSLDAGTPGGAVVSVAIDIPARFVYGCRLLQRVQTYINECDIKSIGNEAFEGTGITEIDLSQEKKCSTVGIAAFRMCTELTKCTLSPEVTAIAASCFEGCFMLQEVSGGKEITTIGMWAFHSCVSLVTFGIQTTTTLTDIGAWAFSGCSSLSGTESLFPSTLTGIGIYAFQDSGITTVDMSACQVGDRDSLPLGLFRNCRQLRSCTVKDTAKTIPESFCEGCSSLAQFSGATDPSDVKERAFSGCKLLTVAAAFLEAYTIGSYAFQGTALTEVTWKQHTDYQTGSYILADCLGLTKCTLTEDCSWIPNYIFCGCTSLSTVDVKSTDLNKIGYGAFMGCTNYQDYTLLKATNIESGAFAGTGFTSLPLNSWSPFQTGSGLFKGCKSLQSCTLGNFFGGSYLPAETFDGCTSLSTITDLNDMQSFGSCALRGCPITSIVFNSAVYSIGSMSFMGTLITAVDLSNCQISEIEEGAFQDCQELRDVTLPTSLNTIKEGAFQECTSLVSITIPETVYSIGNDCFRNCTSLETVTYKGSWHIAGNLFEGCIALKTVNVPSNYQYDDFGGWSFKGDGDGSGNQDGGGKPLPPGGIAGIVIAVLIIVGVAVFLAVFFLVIRKRRNDLAADDDEESPDNTSSIHI